MYVSDLSLSNNVWGRLNKAPSREAHTGTHRGMSAAASVDDAVTERQSFDDVDELFIVSSLSFSCFIFHLQYVWDERISFPLQDDTDQDGSLDKEHMQTIRLLLQRGNAAFRKHRFEEVGRSALSLSLPVCDIISTVHVFICQKKDSGVAISSKFC